MEYLIGALVTVVFFILFLSAFFIGYKLGKPKNKPKPLDVKEKHRQERLQKDFNKLFRYDVETALQRKKVT